MPRRNRKHTRISTVPLEVRKCLFCDTEFMPNRSWQKYCSPTHSTAAHWQRKFGGTAAPAADAPPNIVAKLLEFEDVDLDPLMAKADRAAQVERDMPRGKQTAAARALGGLGYDPYAGIEELKDVGATGTIDSTPDNNTEGSLTEPQQTPREDKSKD